jgi:hypothetical protein
MKTASLLTLILVSGCTVYNRDVVRHPKEDGSIETVISVKHQNNYDLLITTHKIWVNGFLDKTIVQTDTLKSLGTTTRVVDDSFGAAQKRTMRRNYDVYITVK